MPAKGQADTFRVYFDLDIPHLNTTAQKQLDSLIYHDRINASQSILIIGYADYLGSNAHNDRLSARRAANVKSYLEDMHIPPRHIKLCIGTGEIERHVQKEE